MSNKIIYPVLILLFSILFIYAIISNRNINKLNNNLENFQNNYLQSIEHRLKKNAGSNSDYTRDLANGTWTTLNTNADANYNVTNLMTIDIIDVLAKSGTNFGTITLGGSTYNIKLALDLNIIAVSKDTNNLNIHIKLLNKFTDENSININKTFYVPETPNAIVTLYSGNSMLFKYASYKVYNNKVGAEVYRIIKARDYIIEQPPPIYDFNTYNILIGNYTFPSTYISTMFGTTNTSKQNTINSGYGGQIKFTIQRVFASPTGNEIITKNSPPIFLQCISNNQIPNTLSILPFSQDKSANSLINFFKPKSTILYFYKLVNVNIGYDYANNNLQSTSSGSFNLQNNSNNMYQPVVQYNVLNSVEQINTSTYQMTLVKRYDSDLNNPTILNFSDLYSLL
jgi:hypothetical protein